MATIKEVAERANVSVATVSRVINNNTNVKKATREVVEKAVKELKYSPNLSGRILRRNETRIILVLVPTISNPFYSKAVVGIRHAADKQGYLIMVCNTESDANKEIEFLNLLKYKQADGAIVISLEMDISQLEEIGQYFPIVQCFEHHSKGISYVSIDNVQAAIDAVEYLIGLGHRKIAFIGCDSPYPSARQREQGYIEALRKAKIEPDPEMMIHGDYGFKSGYANAVDLLERKKDMTAIFAISDMQAIGAIKALGDRGMCVPEDISVMGFDNISFASIYNPGITTISQPAYMVGTEAVRILIERIKDSDYAPQQVLFKHKLIVRDSTAQS